MKILVLEEASREEDCYTYHDKVVYNIVLDDRKIGEAAVVEPLTEEKIERMEEEEHTYVDDWDTATEWTHCDSIEIYEEYRNNGYGTQALDELKKIYGCYTITPNNSDAQRLYERIGSEDVRYDDALYTDQGYGVYQIGF